jgi:hypothetical protein
LAGGSALARLLRPPWFDILGNAMTDELLRKIQGVLNKRITNEGKVVYLMVELRKLMDRENYTDPVLRTFGDWVVHIGLTRSKGSEFILNEFDHLMIELFDQNRKSNQLTHISLTGFRVALHHCFKEFGLTDNFIKDSKNWKRFVQLYCVIVAECPITFKASKSNLKYIKQVEITGVSRYKDEWRSIDWRLTMHDGRTMNWGFLLL